MVRMLCIACLIALAACSKPKAPDTDKPVDPQSTVRHDDLKRAIDRPIDRAKSVQATLDASAAQQRAEIDAAEGADAGG